MDKTAEPCVVGGEGWGGKKIIVRRKQEKKRKGGWQAG
jgi:hypothetical protein